MERHGSRKKLTKETPFDLHFSVSQNPKEYNVLTDPHANYYFVSKVAKQRLKDLKAQMKKQHKSKSPRKKEMIKLISQKIKFQFPKIKLPLLQGASFEERENEKNRKLSQQFHLKVMTERGRPSHKSSFKEIEKDRFRGEEIQFLGEGLKISQNLKKGRSRKRLKHQKTEVKVKDKVSHDDFLMFLSKKKQEVVPTVNENQTEEEKT